MDEWIRHSLAGNQHGFAALPAAFVLGLLGSVTSCCSLPVVGAVAGYAGSIDGSAGRRRLLAVGGSFLAGTFLALALLGAVTGFVGHAAAAALGTYWRFAGGFLIVLFGLATLGLLSLPASRLRGALRPRGESLGASVVYGLVVGGATTGCSVLCNPLLPVAVAAAVLQGAPVLGAAMLALFALGYALPLALGLVGLGAGLGWLRGAAARVVPVVRVAAGVLLIGLGFYLLAQR